MSPALAELPATALPPAPAFQPVAHPLPSIAAPPAAIPPFPIRPLTVEQFEYLVETGFYGDEKIELLDGWVVNKMTHGDLASYVISRLYRQLSRTLSEAVAIRCQLPIRLKRSRPEPDVVIANGGEARFQAAAPTPEDILVLIEVSDSTLAHDRGPKLRSYARAGIAEYWIVNCVDRQIEVYTRPLVENDVPAYAEGVVYAQNQTISLRLSNEPVVDLPVASLFP